MKDNIAVITIGVDELKEIMSNMLDSKLTSLLAQPLNSSQSEDQLITRKELAERLYMSLPTVSELTKSGKITGYRIGRRILYKWQEVINNLQQANYTKYQRKDLK